MEGAPANADCNSGVAEPSWSLAGGLVAIAKPNTYCPSSAFSNRNAAELMQYRKPVGAGPSGNR